MGLDHLQAFFSEENNEPIQSIKETKQSQDKPILTASIERERQSIERNKEISENIRKSEKLRAEITKGAKDHKPKDVLLLMALECISLMTGDNTWYKQTIEKIEGRL